MNNRYILTDELMELLLSFRKETEFMHARLEVWERILVRKYSYLKPRSPRDYPYPSYTDTERNELNRIRDKWIEYKKRVS